MISNYSLPSFQFHHIAVLFINFSHSCQNLKLLDPWLLSLVSFAFLQPKLTTRAPVPIHSSHRF
jgi:hypothetical protein